MTLSDDPAVLKFSEGLHVSFHRTTRVEDFECSFRGHCFTKAADIQHSKACELTPSPIQGDDETYLLGLKCAPNGSLEGTLIAS